MDKRLYDLIVSWERLGWYDRKKIYWISYQSRHKAETTISVATILVLIAIAIFEPHQQHKAGLLMSAGLLYFYTMLVSYIYKMVYLQGE